jgi:chaperonin GroES
MSNGLKSISRSLTVVETFKPQNDLVLLREYNPERRGLIAIPDTVKPHQPRAIVIAVGPGRMLESGKRNEIMLRAGDVVLLSGPVASLELEGCEKMLLCDQSQVLGVVGEKQ